MIDLDQYGEFVTGVTSTASTDLDTLIARLTELGQSEYNIPRLLTAGIGLPGEAGEFSELVKKVAFHSKPLDEEVRAKMAKELGDVAWYWIAGCLALNLDPEQVILDNVAKLESRYPGGKFSVTHSENRKPGDD